MSVCKTYGCSECESVYTDCITNVYITRILWRRSFRSVLNVTHCSSYYCNFLFDALQQYFTTPLDTKFFFPQLEFALVCDDATSVPILFVLLSSLILSSLLRCCCVCVHARVRKKKELRSTTFPRNVLNYHRRNHRRLVADDAR